MKTIISFSLIFFAFCMVSSQGYSQNGNGCALITNLVIAVDPPVVSPGPVLGVIEISFASNGNSRKAIEVIINGIAHSFIPVGSGTLVSDLILQPGSTLTVTVNTYSTAEAGKGKICSSVTRIIEIP